MERIITVVIQPAQILLRVEKHATFVMELRNVGLVEVIGRT